MPLVSTRAGARKARFSPLYQSFPHNMWLLHLRCKALKQSENEVTAKHKSYPQVSATLSCNNSDSPASIIKIKRLCDAEHRLDRIDM